MSRTLHLVFFTLIFCGSLRAQAWTQGKGSSYSKLSYGAASASEQFSFDGSVKPYADNVEDYAFFDRSLYLYSEYGLTDRYTIVASLPYKRVIIRDAAFRYRVFGIGNLDFGIRRNLNDLLGWDNTSNTLSLNLFTTVPLGYHRNYTPSVGAGQLDFGLGLNYGRSFYPAAAYAQAGFGYKVRSAIFGFSQSVDCQEGTDLGCFTDQESSFSNELLFSAESGYTWNEKVLLQLLIAGTWSTKKPDTGFSVTNPIPTRQRFIKMGSGLRSSLTNNLGISGQVFWTTYGRNTVKSVDIFLGFDYQL